MYEYIWYIAGSAVLLATGIGVLVLTLRPGASTIQATNPTPSSSTTPGGAVPPTSLNWLAEMDRLYQKHWKSDQVIIVPVILCTAMIDYILFTMYPSLIWEPVWKSVWRVVLLHVFFCTALTCMKIQPVWKNRTAVILVVLCFVTLLTNTLGWTTWLSEKKIVEWKSAGTPPVVSAQSTTTPTPTEFEVEAPIDGKWSVWISTRRGEIIRPHGPIFLQDDEWRVIEVDDIANNKTRLLISTNQIRVRSRTEEPVKVTVSR